MEDDAEEEAFVKAVRFIEYRPRSSGEVRSRMRTWKYDQAVSDSVVDRLKRSGLLDDREFARVFVEELMRKGMGPRRIRSELHKKMLDRDLIDEMLEAYPSEEEVERAHEAAVRRFSRLSGGGGEIDARPRVYGYLMRRGFSSRASDAACRQFLQFDTRSGAELE